MKTIFPRWLLLLPVLLLLLSAAPAALAEEGEAPEESLIDEDYLNQWMEEFCRVHQLDLEWRDFSVGFCYTATGDCWYYEPDIFMYSASLYKVPVCMLFTEKLAAGEYSWDDRILDYPVDYLVDRALVYSNNDCGHVLVNELGGTAWGKCSDQSIVFTDLDPEYFPPEFFHSSFYSARYMTQVMQCLCAGSEERFPHMIDCLLRAQPEGYMNLTLKDRWPVAQKYGGYKEAEGPDNNHDAAIIYTPTPIVVVVMTRNVGDYQNRIAEVAEFLAEYSLKLDEKRSSREAALAEEAASRETALAEEAAREAALAEEAAREAAPAEENAPEAAPAEEDAPTPSPAPEPELPAASPLPAPGSEEDPGAALPPAAAPEPEEAPSQPLPLGLWLILGGLVLLAVPVLRHALGRRR